MTASSLGVSVVEVPTALSQPTLALVPFKLVKLMLMRSPAKVGQHLWVVPLASWHHQSFDKEPDVPGAHVASGLTISDYRACTWPSEVLGDLLHQTCTAFSQHSLSPEAAVAGRVAHERSCSHCYHPYKCWTCAAASCHDDRGNAVCIWFWQISCVDLPFTGDQGPGSRRLADWFDALNDELPLASQMSDCDVITFSHFLPLQVSLLRMALQKTAMHIEPFRGGTGMADMRGALNMLTGQLLSPCQEAAWLSEDGWPMCVIRQLHACMSC